MLQHDWSSANPKGPMSPLFVFLRWLPVAAHIKFKTLILAYRTATGSAPTYFHSLMTIYIPSRSLRSAIERRLVVPSQRGTESLSRMFSFTIPGRWNELPTPIRNAESQTIFKRHSFIKKKKKPPLLSLLSLSLSSFFCSEQCLKCCMTSTSSDCLPLYSVSLIVFLNCKSLWIKALKAAKLLLLFAVPSCQC